MVIEQDGLVFRLGVKVKAVPRPVRQVFRHGLVSRLAWPAWATFWMVMTVGLAVDMATSGETWALLMPAVFAPVGGWLWIQCVRAAAWNRVVAFGEDAVSVTQTSTSGREAWQEPLAAYRGVAPLDVRVRNSGRVRTIPTIVLDHENRERRIVLWSMLVSGGRREACRAYADWLGLDVVEPLPEPDGTRAVSRT